MSYKEAHEQFVSGHEGTSALIISLAVTTCIFPLLLRDCVSLLQFPLKGDGFWFSFIRDFLLLVWPVLLTLTAFTENFIFFLLLVVTVTFVIIYQLLSRPDVIVARKSVSYFNIPMGMKRSFVTNYRAYVNVLTAVSILAVDFTIFPRYYAKAETYGKGMMDIGVGSFIISNAIVSPEARGKVSHNRIPSVLKSLKSTIPLLILGTARLVSVKGTDYQEHVTEYGVHWNFFFTLAAVKVLSTLFFSLVPSVLWPLLGPSTILMYQYFLTSCGLADYIQHGRDGHGGREGLMDANREGIASCVGYLAIYFISVQLGKMLLTKRETVKEWLVAMIQVSMVSAAAWILLLLTETYIEPVSRRFANLPFCLWMVGFNSYFMAVLLMMDVIVTCISHLQNTGRKKTDSKAQMSTMETSHCLLAAVNYNGLFYFLFANVLTGLVNLSVQTIYVQPVSSFLILTAYMATVSLATAFLYHKKWLLKFW